MIDTYWLTLAALADIGTTLYGIKIGLVEKNRKLFGLHPSPMTLIYAKVVVVALAVYVNNETGTLLAAAIFGCAAAWNLSLIIRKRRN